MRAWQVAAANTPAEFTQVTRPVPGDNEVLIALRYAALNYKDALALTGQGKILKQHPMIPGVDGVGEVVDSNSMDFIPGQQVLVAGCGLGEDRNGALAEYMVAPADWLVPVPSADDVALRQAVVTGTAGFSAALALYKLQQHGQQPNQGAIVVTGASGGVGQFAVNLLAQQGYRVTALIGSHKQAQPLIDLGAKAILRTDQVTFGHKPLEKAQWAGAVDNLGGDYLAWLTRTMQPGGSIAAIGLASGWNLDTTVMPFILRGINLLGINATYCPADLRRQLWQRLQNDWACPGAAEDYQRISFDHCLTYGHAMLQRKTQGRILVDINPN